MVHDLIRWCGMNRIYGAHMNMRQSDEAEDIKILL